MPGWVDAGYQEYARRLPREFRLTLTEIAPGRRGKDRDAASAVAEEGRRMARAIPAGARVIALETDGRDWTTAQLADALRGWFAGGRDVALLVGGPDGLAAECRERAEMAWSLSPLTLPHGLVRVVLAEALYRAHSLAAGHPYHR